MVWKFVISGSEWLRSKGRERLESGLVDYNAEVEGTQQKPQLGGCKGREGREGHCFPKSGHVPRCRDMVTWLEVPKVADGDSKPD